ncbi:MAG: DUF1501 domain-containing protein [Candidatus Rokubacteria bacterium]|nr:DUF1501 domain-containing protein [Candidatus Rokubacteria bacterium]
MMTRRLLLRSGACALVGLAAPPRFLFRAAAAAEGRRNVLVAIFQRGAADGLSMIPPHGDPAYAAARPGIVIAAPRGGDADRAIDLDGFFGLHPTLAPLLPLWTNRSLAVVHACGSPDTSRSHFDAQDYMESGTPGVKSTLDGWLNRAAKSLPAPASPLRAVAVGPSLPRSLRGDAGAIAMQNVGAFDVRGGDMAGGDPRGGMTARQGFESLYEQGVRDVLQGTGRETFEAVRLLKSAQVARSTPANGADYPRARFGESLRQIAALIRADVGLEIAFADVGGWDTHVAQGNERGQLANRLREFAAALGAFTRDLGDRMADVVVLTMSEFGRTVAENGNRGTDHGHATAMLVLGGPVRGGRVYGRWPGLGRAQLFEERDLAVTTDFRALFHEVAVRHLGLSPHTTLFPGWRSPGGSLGLFV